jgi:hypothetical protein
MRKDARLVHRHVASSVHDPLDQFRYRIYEISLPSFFNNIQVEYADDHGLQAHWRLDPTITLEDILPATDSDTEIDNVPRSQQLESDPLPPTDGDVPLASMEEPQSADSSPLPPAHESPRSRTADFSPASPPSHESPRSPISDIIPLSPPTISPRGLPRTHVPPNASLQSNISASPGSSSATETETVPQDPSDPSAAASVAAYLARMLSSIHLFSDVDDEIIAGKKKMASFTYNGVHRIKAIEKKSRL